MSRYYEMILRVEGHDQERHEDIKEAVQEEFEFETTSSWEPDMLTFTGQGNLCGGESEEEFTLRMSERVWEANESYCKVTVVATCLEYVPSDTHETDEAMYNEWKADQEE